MVESVGKYRKIRRIIARLWGNNLKKLIFGSVEMSEFLNIYECNIEELDRRLFVNENFDIIKKKLCVGHDELTFYYIDGFVKD